MASKRKQDEKHLNLLRAIVKLESNKQCFDCGQKGPTYINMTIGSFVCTSCSGILRGLTPPHRVKSISMASFSPEEIEFIRSRGNSLNKKVYLGLHNAAHIDFDSKDENKVRDFMMQTYEKKRFYVAPTEQMFEEARNLNTPPKTEPTTRPLRPIGNIPKLGQNNIVTNQIPTQPSRSIPQPVSQPATQPSTQPATQPAFSQPNTQPRVDLLSDLGGDPFQPSAPKHGSVADRGGFADFGAFSSVPPQNQSLGGFPASHAQTAAFPTGGMLSPLSTASHQPQQRQATNSLFGAPPTAPPGGGDKYSALADLDSAFSQSTTSTSPAIDWNSMPEYRRTVSKHRSGAGLGGGWGGASSSHVTATQVPPSSAAFSAAGNPFGGGGGGTGAMSTAANPFAAFSTSPVNSSGFSAHHPTPFSSAHSQNNASASFGPMSGGHGVPASTSLFGNQMTSLSTATSSSSAFMTSPMQNGGVGAGWNATGAQMGGHPATMFNSYGHPAGTGVPGMNSAAGGFGAAFAQPGMPPKVPAGGVFVGIPTTSQYSQQAQMMGGWGAPAQPAANPFMNISSQAPAPRATNSTNPFL